MTLKGRDREFRLNKLSYIDFKPINMDQVLIMLFLRLRLTAQVELGLSGDQVT